MKRKFKKPISMFFMVLTITASHYSCKKDVNLAKKQGLTSQEQSYLTELDAVIQDELNSPEKKNSGNVNPENSNNPYDYIGNHVKEVMNCALNYTIDGESSAREAIEACNNQLTENSLSIADVPTFEELRNINPEVSISESQLSPLGQKIASKYVNTMMKISDANTFVRLSIAFENSVLSTRLLNDQDKEQIVVAITANKHAIATVNSIISSNDDALAGISVGCGAAWVGVALSAVGAIASGGALLPVAGFFVGMVGVGEGCGCIWCD